MLLQVSELCSEHAPDDDVRRRHDGRRTAAIADDRQLAEEIPRTQPPDLLFALSHRGRPVPEDVERVTGSPLLREGGAALSFLDVEPRSDLLQLRWSQLGEQWHRLQVFRRRSHGVSPPRITRGHGVPAQSWPPPKPEEVNIG